MILWNISRWRRCRLFQASITRSSLHDHEWAQCTFESKHTTVGVLKTRLGDDLRMIKFGDDGSAAHEMEMGIKAGSCEFALKAAFARLAIRETVDSV